MNKIFTPPPRRPTTRAADGLPRWRWTVAEIEKMAVDGYFREEEQFELVGGEIVPMSPKGRRHEIIRGELAFRFTRLAPDDVFVIAEPQFNLADDTYLNPDILVHPASLKTPDVRGADALLVIEVADTSLRYDLNTKAPIYATHGVREYWVINAGTLITMVHKGPSDQAYGFVQEVAPNAMLAPSLVPAFAMSLGVLELD
ncbi:MAG TPA: Uma2 family endonuclease [Xanthobacteraceae bacterium]|jgi:Uma2 family endonuclease|nr:Uma2 family endonuclease [Xanthobacteraceae bacterium]